MTPRTERSTGCGSGHCGCAEAETSAVPSATPTVATINGVPLHAPGESLSPEALQERAFTELLRQEAVRRGLLPRAATLEMPVLDDAQQQVIHAMLDADVPLAEPTDEEARRYHEGHRSRFVRGAKVRLRHILFAVTPNVDIEALRQRAEAQLIALRCEDAAAFAAAAAELSNCPSGAQGGDLGWANPGMFVPEFERVMDQLAPGQISQPLISRFGVHLIQLLERRNAALSEREQRELVRGMLRERKTADTYENWVRDVRARAYVELREAPQQ